MGNPVHDVPWANLWRWVVSSLFFFFVFFLVVYAPIALFTEIDPASIVPVEAILIVISAVVAAIVVWSDDIPWPGDPERDRA